MKFWNQPSGLASHLSDATGGDIAAQALDCVLLTVM